MSRRCRQELEVSGRIPSRRDESRWVRHLDRHLGPPQARQYWKSFIESSISVPVLHPFLLVPLLAACI